jgi:hypothetical protein
VSDTYGEHYRANGYQPPRGGVALSAHAMPLNPAERMRAEAQVRLLPIRPRSRGARRSLRTFPVVTLHPRFPFNV